MKLLIPTHRIAIHVLVGLTVWVAAQAQAGSMRCNGKLIEPGDPKARLITECGAPISRDIVAVERATAGGPPIRLEYVEAWTYPVPSTVGFQLLRFEGGRLAGEGMRCGGEIVRPGDTTRTVAKRCGEPISRDAAGLAPAAPSADDGARIVDVPIEQWVYDRGPGRFAAIVTLSGGRVASIEDGARQ